MIDLQTAVVYDIETTVSAFTMNVQGLFSDLDMTFEISVYRDDRAALLAWFDHWKKNRTLMIGFNSIAFDYPVIHFIYTNPDCALDEIYEAAQERISDHTGFGTIWQSDRFAPQLDLYKLHHFDNTAKRTSLKALQFAMRSESVMEMPLPFDEPISDHDVQRVLIPYNKHDVAETKKFAHFSMEAINFRIGLMETLPGDVLNFSDGKIGRTIIQQKLGDKLCFEFEGKRKVPRQTPRESVALNDIIFPYIEFKNPEFNRILSWMRTQTLTSDEFSEKIKTKGVFANVKANVGGIDFHFGTGGIHGSVEKQHLVADSELAIVDVDVAQLYPNIAIQNGLYPEHLGKGFVDVYATVPAERKEWQKKKGKKCVEANSLKLASNVPYGDSNNQFSFMYDPRYTMATTVNGQLMLCMLAEWLLTVPTLQIIAINTDGISYKIHRSQLEHAEIIRDIWMRRTRLVLEEVRYSRMWIRDVNSYIAESDGGELKLKGAFWFPRSFPDDISNAQPPGWHKDYSAQIVIMAAVEHMTRGIDIDLYVYQHTDPFDFMLRAKVDRASKLMIGDREVQRITRYFMALNGEPMRKVSPPKGEPGTYKRKNGISDRDYYSVLKTLSPDTWDARIHTANKSKYETREMAIESRGPEFVKQQKKAGSAIAPSMAGNLVRECNRASDFDFENLNRAWYVEQAQKLVIK